MSRGDLQDFWQARSARERIVLVSGPALVVMLLGYVLLWRPMLQDSVRMEEQLPRLRAQAAQIGRAGDEIARLRGKAPAGSLDPAQLATLIERSAATHGLQGSISKADKNSPRVSAAFERVLFSAWVSWVDELHRNHRIVLVSSKLNALDVPGMIRAEAEFAPAAALK